jgi:hypothetical protein
MCDALKKYKEARLKHDADIILDFLSRTGISKDLIKEDEVEYIELAKKVDTLQAYYYYKGRYDDKTRPFCKRVLDLNKYWGETDLLMISERLGYSVFLFQGGFNCRHIWQKARISKKQLETGAIIPDQPKTIQIWSAANRQQKGLGKYFPLA